MISKQLCILTVMVGKILTPKLILYYANTQRTKVHKTYHNICRTGIYVDLHGWLLLNLLYFFVIFVVQIKTEC